MLVFPTQHAMETVSAEKGEVQSEGLPINKENSYLVRSGRSVETMTATAIVRLDHSFSERRKREGRAPRAGPSFQLPGSLDMPLC